MEYTEELAAKIAATHNIPAATLRVWKLRGKIPAKYFSPEGEVLTKKQENITEEERYFVLRLYEAKEINFSALKSVSMRRLSDLERGKGLLTKEEYINLKREIADLKNVCAAAFSAKTHDACVRALHKCFADPRLKPYTLHEHKNTIDRLIQKEDIDSKDAASIVRKLGLLFQRINL